MFGSSNANNGFTADDQAFIDGVELSFSTVATLGAFDDSDEVPQDGSMVLDLDAAAIDELASEYVHLQGWAASLTGVNVEAF